MKKTHYYYVVNGVSMEIKKEDFERALSSFKKEGLRIDEGERKDAHDYRVYNYLDNYIGMMTKITF